MKKIFLTICLVVLLLIISFIAGFSVTKSQAVVPLGFGGRLIDFAYCPCSDSLWLFYAPMLDGPFPGGALSWSEYDTVTYPFYNMVTPGVWHLGLFLPGVQGCWVYDWDGCYPIPVLGHEVMVGTSAEPEPF